MIEQQNDQQVEMVSAEQSKIQLEQLLSGESPRVEISVDTPEEAHRELARMTNLNKSVIMSSLIGRNFLSTKDSQKAKTLSKLFVQYFKGTVNQVYTEEDLVDLANLLKEEQLDSLCHVRLPKHVPVKKGLYQDKQSCLFLQGATPDGKSIQYVIGASRADCSVYFVFTNEKSDVNSGVIYVRNSVRARLRRVNTFEINPFVRGRGIVTNKETGETDAKDQLTFNPNWLANTVDNMEKYVFAPLVWTPPKPPKLLKKNKGVTEVDMVSLIEKTLSQVHPGVDGEKVAEEVRQGIDNYREKALAEIAKNQNEVPEVVNPETIAHTHAENQQAQCDIGKGVTLCPEVASLCSQPIQDTSFVETVLRMEGNIVSEDGVIVDKDVSSVLGYKLFEDADNVYGSTGLPSVKP